MLVAHSELMVQSNAIEGCANERNWSIYHIATEASIGKSIGELAIASRENECSEPRDASRLVISKGGNTVRGTREKELRITAFSMQAHCRRVHPRMHITSDCMLSNSARQCI